MMNNKEWAKPPHSRIPLGGLFLILCAVAIATVIAVVSHVNSRSQAEAHRDEVRLYERDRHLDALLQAIGDAESGQRGFLLTGEVEYLESYRQSPAAIDRHYRELQSLVRLPITKERVKNLRPLIDQKLADLRQTIDLAWSGRTQEALRIVQSRRGKQLRDEIDQIGAMIRIDGNERLRADQMMDENSAKSLRVWGVGGTILLVALLTFGAFTIRRDAENARELLDATLRSIGGGVIVTNAKGEIVFLNDVAVTLTGWTEAEAIGEFFDAVFEPRDEKTHALVAVLLSRVLDQHNVVNGDVILHGKNGSRTPIGYLAAPITGDAGMILVFRDATERHNAVRAIEQANSDLARVNAALARRTADLEQFSYAASHDLREPLRTIASFSEMLAEMVPKNAEAQRCEQYVRTGVRQMETLIDGLLAYAKASSPGGDPYAPVSMQTVLDDALASLQASIRESGARIKSDPLPAVVGNQAQLTQVLQNLIGNAIKYRGGSSPNILVTVERENGSYVFHVRDNGVGFDLKHANRLFHLFARLHTKAKYPGSGIGLVLCRRIIEMHGGTIWAESEPGKGSTFSFALPAAGDVSVDPRDSASCSQEATATRQSVA